jgi:hypothetical protein
MKIWHSERWTFWINMGGNQFLFQVLAILLLVLHGHTRMWVDECWQARVFMWELRTVTGTLSPTGNLKPNLKASPSLFTHAKSCLLRRPSLCHGKVTISRGTAESCKMNKCCSKPALLKKADLFVQRWCEQQTLSLKNASFHVLRVAILIYKFHAAFL